MIRVVLTPGKIHAACLAYLVGQECRHDAVYLLGGLRTYELYSSNTFVGFSWGRGTEGGSSDPNPQNPLAL